MKNLWYREVLVKAVGWEIFFHTTSEWRYSFWYNDRRGHWVVWNFIWNYLISDEHLNQLREIYKWEIHYWNMEIDEVVKEFKITLSDIRWDYSHDEEDSQWLEVYEFWEKISETNREELIELLNWIKCTLNKEIKKFDSKQFLFFWERKPFVSWYITILVHDSKWNEFISDRITLTKKLEERDFDSLTNRLSFIYFQELEALRETSNSVREFFELLRWNTKRERAELLKEFKWKVELKEDIPHWEN